jgi:hypothetical protein
MKYSVKKAISFRESKKWESRDSTRFEGAVQGRYLPLRAGGGENDGKN